MITDLTEKTMKNGMDMQQTSGVKQGLVRTRKVKKRKRTITATVKVVEKLMTRAMTMRSQIAVVIRQMIAMAVMMRRMMRDNPKRIDKQGKERHQM